MPLSKFSNRVLWQRAEDYLTRYHPAVIGITGSTGKTLTRMALELLLKPTRLVRSVSVTAPTPATVAAAVLGQVAAERRGVGLSSFLAGSKIREWAEEEPETILLEVNATAPGQIDWVGRNLPLTLALITNVHSQHLDYFSEKRLLAHEYASLLANLGPTGTACLNADDPLVAEMKNHTQAKVITFGAQPGADVELTRWQRLSPSLESTGFAIEIMVGQKQYQCSVPQLVSPHQLSYILGAIAAAVATNLDLASALKRLHSLKLLPTQTQWRVGRKHTHVLDASFDATPESMLAMLTGLQAMKAPRKIAILGDLADLGGMSITWHKEIGSTAAQVADMVILVGRAMSHAAPAARTASPQVDVHEFAEVQEVVPWLTRYLKADDLIFVSGGRSQHMSQIVAALS